MNAASSCETFSTTNTPRNLGVAADENLAVASLVGASWKLDPAWFHQLRLRCTFVRCERRFQPRPCHVLPNVEARGGGELVADVVVEADADRHGNWLSCGGTVFALIIVVSMVSLGRACGGVQWTHWGSQGALASASRGRPDPAPCADRRTVLWIEDRGRV